MQVAARETQKSSDLMGSFGLNLYDEGRVEEGRRMKYWSKMEELLLTGSARQRRRRGGGGGGEGGEGLEGGEGEEGGEGGEGEEGGEEEEGEDLLPPPFQVGVSSSFPSMERAEGCEMYLTLVAGACGTLTKVPEQYVREYERMLWKAGWNEEKELMFCIEKKINENEQVDGIIAEKIKKFVWKFTKKFVQSKGIHAMGEEIVPAQMSHGV